MAPSYHPAVEHIADILFSNLVEFAHWPWYFPLQFFYLAAFISALGAVAVMHARWRRVADYDFDRGPGGLIALGLCLQLPMVGTLLLGIVYSKFYNLLLLDWILWPLVYVIVIGCYLKTR